MSRKFVDLVLAVDRVDIEGRGVAVAAVGDELLSLCDSVLKALRLVHSENGAELLVSEFLADIYALDLADKNLCRFGNLNAGELRDSHGLLTDDTRVERAVDDDSLSDLLAFLVVEEVAAARLEFFLDLGVNLLLDDNALL